MVYVNGKVQEEIFLKTSEGITQSKKDIITEAEVMFSEMKTGNKFFHRRGNCTGARV